MVSFYRIGVIAQRYFWGRITKFEDLTDFLFWPVLDIITWGGVGLLLAKHGQGSQNLMLSILSVVMMRVFLYAYFNNAANFLYEMMARNIINLYSTPLTFYEWFCGAMLSGCAVTALLMLFAQVVSWLIFGVNLACVGAGIIIFVIPLLISGWALSAAALITLMLFGVHGQRLIWVLSWFFVPFSGVYYSLENMPVWVQVISYGVPMNYVFQALRIFMLEGRLSATDLVYGYGLSCIYFITMLVACNAMFERSRRHGLASLERA